VFISDIDGQKNDQLVGDALAGKSGQIKKKCIVATTGNEKKTHYSVHNSVYMELTTFF
jgi:hypothetical protein